MFSEEKTSCIIKQSYTMLSQLFNKITLWNTGSTVRPLHISKVNIDQFLWFLASGVKEGGPLSDQTINLIFPTLDEAEDWYDRLRETYPHEVLFFPGLEYSPFSGYVPCESNLLKRFFALDQLSQKKPIKFIITTIEALSLKLPPQKFFRDNRILLEPSTIIDPYQLAENLVNLGYQSTITVEEPGTFSRKGEIFDIFPISSGPFRIHYFDEMIEEIYAIDRDSNKTLKDRPLKQVSLGPAPQIIHGDLYANNLRSNIPMPGPKYKEKFLKRKKLFDLLSSQILPEDYVTLMPLFFGETQLIADYLPAKTIHIELDASRIQTSLAEYKEEVFNDIDHDIENLNSDCLISSPGQIYSFSAKDNNKHTISVDPLNIIVDFNEQMEDSIQFSFQPIKPYLLSQQSLQDNQFEFKKVLADILNRDFKYSGDIIFNYINDSSKNEFENYLNTYPFERDIKNRVQYFKFKLNHGFLYENDKLIVLSESDFFTSKSQKTKKQQSRPTNLFAEQLSTLQINDYVIHSQHGMGIYKGLENLNLSGFAEDFLVIQYANNDKVYVPVYKLNLIQKHASAGQSLKPESLRSNKFSLIKTKARQSAKKLAFDLLKLQAERQAGHAFAFSDSTEEYYEFEKKFPFQETPDQLTAIKEVNEAMQSSRPMDYLVCGDVGFGKTEVAMRAAFKAVLDNKQVGVLVPTTVLALQHYNSFKKRFKDFPVNIDFISRLKTPKEVTETLSKLEDGSIDILIGTHKLLSSKIKYKDLGLVIVDEEQRFGVTHKEKLKLLKTSVDFLTLSATPIPRTLQLAFLGIKDLSLIKTAPPKRQSIKTYLIKQDDLTIKNAILKELKRGGQAFIVHNKVQDIEAYADYIQKLVPEARIVIGHGQLPERELEKRMNSFYRGDYQILIATTIIESGIDIPTANTMIIDRADNFGLSQLHQLRGRIGRSDKKAYAYFIIPRNKTVSPEAEKRLKALQTYAEVGSGFNIATCDLEIRGAGDILGANQSGHVEAVGLELYMELLKDAIHELKGEKRLLNQDIEIQTSFPSYIPNNYITDHSERLKTYKTISSFSSLQEIEEQISYMEDVYGVLPIELKNLFLILRTRINFQNLAIKSVKLIGKSIFLIFDREILDREVEIRNQVIDFFIARPKIYQFTPDYKVIFSSQRELLLEDLLEFSTDISQQIVPH